MHPNHGPNLFTQLVHPTRGTDLWSLKKELFRIGLGDLPHVARVRLVDRLDSENKRTVVATNRQYTLYASRN